MTLAESFTPWPVLMPLLAAAFFAAFGSRLNRHVVSAIAVLITGAVLAFCIVMAFGSANAPIIYWFGSWKPDPAHYPVGVCFTVTPISAGMAALVALLEFAALLFSDGYFDEVKALFHTLMLTFLAAMCGLCLSGDLFNLFVWFELMTASAVALCGYMSMESWPLIGSLNFAVMNTAGAFLTLIGIGTLYAWTGTLNLAESARSLALHPPGPGFVAIVFMLICCGFLVKAAMAPFQFWLADAHAVAPTPVCVLFSGVMVELGLYAVARVYWGAFAPVLPPGQWVLREVLLSIGVATAIVGAVYSFSQRHLKRLLAFSTISHAGLMMIGLGSLTAGAMSGLAVYVIGHGLVKGMLFLAAGIILHRCGSEDEFDLRGQGRKIWPLGVVMLLGAAGLCSLPPFATYYGSAQMDTALAGLHVGWIHWIRIFAEALTAAGVFRMTARIFLGLGLTQEASSRGSPHVKMNQETSGQHDRTPITMWAGVLLLVLIFPWVAIPRAWRDAVAAGSWRFEQTSSNVATVLNYPAPQVGSPPASTPVELTWVHFLPFVIAVLLAALALFPRVLGRANRWIGHWIIAFLRPWRKLQSGNTGDYVAWLVLGLALWTGIFVWLQTAQ